MSQVSSVVAITRKQTLHASISRACKNCGAPGVYHNVQGVNPGCYDPDRVDQPVGPICPNCHAKRDPDEDLGQIWSKEFGPPASWPVMVWRRLKHALRRKWP